MGHRGAPVFEPENTLRSYERAIEMGMEMVEVDLRRSADVQLVLAHDETIHNAEGQTLKVAEHPLEELRRLDLGEGERIPTLEDAIRLCQGRCALMIDLKGEGFEEALVETLHETGFTDLVIPGGSAFSRARIRELDPSLPLSLSLDRSWKSRITDDFISGIETDAVTWQYSLLDAPAVERLHALGKIVFAWTVDSEEEMDRLLSIGVDGIISNRTDFLAKL